MILEKSHFSVFSNEREGLNKTIHSFKFVKIDLLNIKDLNIPLNIQTKTD